MDPKLSGLDPKLREAYERVMNGPTGPGGSTPPAPNQQPNQEQPQTPVQTSNPVSPTPPAPTPSPVIAPAPLPVATPSSNTSFNAGSYQAAQGTTAVKKAGGKMSTILILLGLVILLVAYTFVWVFLFDLKIPFLPF